MAANTHPLALRLRMKPVDTSNLRRSIAAFRKQLIAARKAGKSLGILDGTGMVGMTGVYFGAAQASIERMERARLVYELRRPLRSYAQCEANCAPEVLP